MNPSIDAHLGHAAQPGDRHGGRSVCDVVRIDLHRSDRRHTPGLSDHRVGALGIEIRSDASAGLRPQTGRGEALFRFLIKVRRQRALLQDVEIGLQVRRIDCADDGRVQIRIQDGKTENELDRGHAQGCSTLLDGLK